MESTNNSSSNKDNENKQLNVNKEQNKNEVPVKVPKKRGRKPKPKPLVEVPKIPKKRGRKPKPKPLFEVPKVPKKRGRKPKPKNPEDEKPKIPRKRGRKPKEKIYSIDQKIVNHKPKEYNILFIPVNSDDINNENELMSDQILKYNPSINIPKPYEPGYNKTFSMCEETLHKNNKDNNDEIQYNDKYITGIDSLNLQDINMGFMNSINNEEGLLLTSQDYQKIKENHLQNKKTDEDILVYNKKTVFRMLPDFYDANNRNEWPKSTNVRCWWCTLPFDNTPCGLPHNYINNVFHVSGCFCSFNCALSYGINYPKKFTNLWDKISLLHLLYKKIHNNYKIIFPAPPKEILTIYGGSLSIEEYKKSNKSGDRIFNVLVPPIVSIIPFAEDMPNRYNPIEKKEKYIPVNENKLNKANQILKLKRNKPILSGNTLEKCMGITQDQENLLKK